MNITVHTKTIRGRKYGSVPVVVSLGGAPMDGFAVTCNDERWICTREDCIRWLTERGLNADEADLLIDLGEALEPEKEPIPPLAVQHQDGEYLEEIEKIVDGVVEDIQAKKLSKLACRDAVEIAALNSSYVHEPRLWGAVMAHSSDRKVRLRVQSAVGHEFRLAAVNELLQRAEYKALPE